MVECFETNSECHKATEALQEDRKSNNPWLYFSLGVLAAGATAIAINKAAK